MKSASSWSAVLPTLALLATLGLALDNRLQRLDERRQELDVRLTRIETKIDALSSCACRPNPKVRRRVALLGEPPPFTLP